MSARTSASFCLMVCLLLCLSQALENITAVVGQEVTLKCKVNNNNIIAVDWSRTDLDPEYVLQYKDGYFDPEYQDPSYENRVDLQDKEMKDGDVSLKLMNVTMNDTGTYECWVSQRETNHRKTPTSSSTTDVVLEALENITTVVGQEVTLPCKVNNNKTITAVEWSRPELDPEYILLYKDGHFDPDYQHPFYQNRVDLKDKEMKDGDVSLILKNVKMEDRGTYECRVFHHWKRSTIKPISIIYLVVGPSGGKDGGDKDGGDKDGGDKDGGHKDGGDKDGGDKDGNTGDGGKKVGIILGVVGLIVLVASVGFLVYRRCHKNSNLPDPTDEAAAEQML